MANPITWQNVAGNALENAWRPMQGAVTTIDSGFDRLMKMITDRQEANQGVADRAREANVQSLLDKYQSAATPEAVAALKASGELDPLRAAIDPRDAARVRGADEARLTATQQLQAAARKNAEDDFLYTNKGVIAQAQALAAQGKKQEALDLAKPLMDHPIYGDLVAKAVAGDQHVQTFNDTLQNSDVKRKTETSNAAANTSNAATNAGQLQISRLDHAIQQQQRIQESLGKIGANTIGGQGSLDTMIGDIQKTSEDKGQTAKMASLVSEALSSNPKYANLPVDTVKEITLKQLRNVGHGFWNMLDPRTDMNSTVISALKEDFDKALTDKTVSARVDAATSQRTQLQEQLKLYTPILDEARRGVFPNTQAQIDAAAGRAAAGSTPADAAVPAVAADSIQNARDMILGRGQVADPAAAAAPPTLPAPTQRFNNPPDSVAGRAEARAFAEQQAAAAANAPQVAVQAAREQVATDEAKRQIQAQLRHTALAQEQVSAQLKQREGQAQADQAQQQSSRLQAQSTAETLLSGGNARALARFQLSPAFELLDKATKGKIFQAVNNGSGPGKAR